MAGHTEEKDKWSEAVKDIAIFVYFYEQTGDVVIDMGTSSHNFHELSTPCAMQILITSLVHANHALHTQNINVLQPSESGKYKCIPENFYSPF